MLGDAFEKIGCIAAYRSTDGGAGLAAVIKTRQSRKNRRCTVYDLRPSRGSAILDLFFIALGTLVA